MPAAKRKADPIVEQDGNPKRKRTASFSRHQATVNALPNLRFTSNTQQFIRSEPSEDGEVREDLVPPPPPPRVTTAAISVPSVPAQSSSSRDSGSTDLATATTTTAAISSDLPVRRPKHGMPSSRHFDYLHEHFYAAGRKLKYSGDARFWSTFSPTHKEYRPLPDPPPPNSSYHKHGGLIARLELVHALICFTYALWARDQKQRTCNMDNWTTIAPFISWCKTKWQDETVSEAEKAFHGLICMLESYVHTRKLIYLSRRIEPDLDSVVQQAASDIAVAIVNSEKAAADPNSGLLGVKPDTAPQMLPSPASIAPANSANSTPTNRDGSTPSSHSERSPSAPANIKPGPPIPSRLLPSQYTQSRPTPIPVYVTAAANTVTIPIGPQLIGGLKELTSTLKTSAYAATSSQQQLTLPVMARCFPKTFSRMIHSSLSVTEEYEPDMDDEECELLWPGSGINGEGLGWLCLMGQAMIKEFGKAYGYIGLDGVVRKPQLDEDGPHRLSQRLGSTPHGATPPVQR